MIRLGMYGSDLSEHPVDALRRYNLEAGDNREIIEPDDNQLFIDIDNKDDLNLLYAMLDTLQLNGVAATVERVTPSRTEGHYHAVVRLDRTIDSVTRVAFQACLGSDRKRELLSLLRIVLGLNRPPTVFFEVPAEKESRFDDDDIPF